MSEILTATATHSGNLAALLAAIPAGRRAAALQTAAAFLPNASLDASFEVGPIRAAFADLWEATFAVAPPICRLRECFSPPVPAGIASEFGKLCRTTGVRDLQPILEGLIVRLARQIDSRESIDPIAPLATADASRPGRGSEATQVHHRPK